MSVWAKSVNDRGGLQCHPVQLYQEDDASDPSKAASNIQDLVHNKHAIAIVGADMPIVIGAGRSAADQAQVPIVGGDLVATDWNSDSNLYPSGGSGLAVVGGGIAQAAADTGDRKVGLLYCVEASICGVIHQDFAQIVAPSHAEAVFQQSVSLTQSSFTAECQNAKQAGVQILFFAADASSGQRIASNCNSIAYHPVLVTADIAASSAAINDANIKADTLYIGAAQVPFIGTGLPALTVFQDAYRSYTGALPPDQSAMKGWASGQLFAAAINALGAAARGVRVTPAMVVDGLHMLKNETLDGLSPPLNFVAGKPAPLVNCYYTVKDTAQGLVAPKGIRSTCT
jgi:branched-chain amino acid transport system substrate-binding protein